eukprot:gnl/TRDRNA2_/TRDRNA2_162000_c0_seq1.p1 gnl/TRDRNA2_/TRDRNA2_162000_c0~~gnl/TRDRNA2_/TRDRNA2_162000_c0_seq1.p1  ORF type:complete len:319 (+),score=45.48 gnl/TRDRNA2_/TRDRNA2_162000_c0_seq1:49-957(+)
MAATPPRSPCKVFRTSFQRRQDQRRREAGERLVRAAASQPGRGLTASVPSSPPSPPGLLHLSPEDSSHLRDDGSPTWEAGIQSMKSVISPREAPCRNMESSNPKKRNSLPAGMKPLSISEGATPPAVASSPVGRLREWSSPRLVEVEQLMVNPHEVLFASPAVLDRFSCGRRVKQTIGELEQGKVRVEDIPVIRVIERYGRLVTLDHRRLYAFQAALPEDAEIPVKLVQSELTVHAPLPLEAKFWKVIRKTSGDRPFVPPAKNWGSLSCPNLENPPGAAWERDRFRYYRDLVSNPWASKVKF